MARQVVLLALIFFAIVGLASAVDSTPGAAAGPAIMDADGNNDLIGTGEDDSEAAPIGGPVPEGAFASASPAQSPKSGAPVLEVSSVAAGVVAVTASLFF